MSKEKFNILESTCIPLPLENIDTDQIIPARFLSLTSREGFGEYLFRDWRFDKSGNKIEGCVFNDPRYSGQVLVSGKNFGSGSSREHAVWAIAGYGFRAVVSSFFADIFRNNCLNNGILPVVVKEDYLQNLLKTIKNDPSVTVRIDLEKQLFTVLPDGESVSFEINKYKKECLLNGLDDIDYLLSIQDAIKAYELRKTLGK
ncbi:MAG: 3-isopropylmalate dehydratase small subunit [Bacteroidales bacterium]|jgi:3-isopropylmalate/(R)-2-methylmalate dehydratase small subunit|nr:3-isopropylmalate dehydratase small subunit [Bacteroidales bacterium]